jgi:hypothetical protein
VNGIFLGPLPVPDGDRLVRVWDYHRAGRYNVYIRYEEFERRARTSTSFSGLAAYYTRNLPLESPQHPARVVRGAFITPVAFELFGVDAATGRSLIRQDQGAGATPVIVLSDSLWRTLFAADPDIIGKPLRSGNEWRTVVSVMPAGIRFPEREDFWVPLQASRAGTVEERLCVFGKLRADTTITQAEAELNVLGSEDARDYKPGEIDRQKARP